MKLRTKTHLYSSVLFAALLLVANGTVYLIFHHLTIERELDQMAAETEQASAAIRAADNPAAVAELLRAYVPLNGMIRLVQEDSPTAAAGNEPLVTSPTGIALSDQPSVYHSDRQAKRISIEGDSYGFVSIPVIGADGAVLNVQVTSSMAELMVLLGILRIVLLSVSAAVMIPAIISSGILGGLIMRPIAAMTKTMREIASSGQFVRLKQDGRSKDELVEMGETFNEMIGLLEISFSKQEQFVSNASHELKTPLTIIESYASLLKRRGMERPELFLESVEAIHSEAVRMKGLTEQLLLLAKPHKHWLLTMDPVDLFPFAEQAATSFGNAFKRQLIVERKADQPPVVVTDADLLKQLLYILLDNARKYSSEAITVTVGTNSGQAYIEVKDQGIGIPREELPLVFNRFYRVDKARSRDSEQEGGTGLGLSLAQEISAALGSVITLASEEGKGTTATLVFVSSGAPAVISSQ